MFASLRKCKRILNKPGPWRFVDLWISFFSITFCSFFIWRRLLKGIRRIWRNKKFSKERKRGYFSWEFLKNSILSKMRFARNDFDSKKVNFLKQWKIPQKDKEIFEYFLYIFLENFKSSILFENYSGIYLPYESIPFLERGKKEKNNNISTSIFWKYLRIINYVYIISLYLILLPSRHSFIIFAILTINL